MLDIHEGYHTRRSHHIVFTEGELDLPALRATPELQSLLKAGWFIAKYAVVLLEDGYAITVFFQRPSCGSEGSGRCVSS